MPFLRTRLAKLYDGLYTARNRHTVERIVVWLSVVGFLAHLAHVALARNIVNPPPIIAAAGKDYLSAIYTPFSFILFYEVLILIGALPQSTTQSIATQFEIVSLIFIRGFFKEIAQVDMGSLGIKELKIPMVGAATGLLMFLLVVIFLKLARRRPLGLSEEEDPELVAFIERKKAIALALILVFLAMTAAAVTAFFGEAMAIVRSGAGVLPETKPTLYTDMFTIMIFTDVLILILSLMVSDRYELVFRNAAFVIATILIRLSLTVEYPWGAAIGLVGMIFGIATLAVYNYHGRAARRV